MVSATLRKMSVVVELSGVVPFEDAEIEVPLFDSEGKTKRYICVEFVVDASNTKGSPGTEPFPGVRTKEAIFCPTSD